MKFPNQHCGECSRWLAFCEPDTPEEINQEIISYCNNCCEVSIRDRELTDIYDVMICPDCNSDDCYKYDTDETEFDVGGTGHYYVDCHCRQCGNNFRLYMEFEYSVTKAYTR